MAAEARAPGPPDASGPPDAAGSTAAGALVDAVVDQHDRLRVLLQAAARAPEDERDAACATALRHLAVHVVAEAVALDGARGTRTRQEARAMTGAVERLHDLGTACPTYHVQLGLIAAEIARHVRAGEAEVLPGFVATRDEEDLVRAVEVLREGERLAADRAPDALVPGDAGFAHQLREARAALRAERPERPPSHA